MNYYETDAYRQKVNLLEAQLFSKNCPDEPERVTELENGYRVTYDYYSDTQHCLPGYAPAEGEICRFYHQNELVFTWKNTYGRSRMAKLIHHSNGNDYFVFDEDLYGYSVLDLKTLECMHYLPAESYREPPEASEETFLWCDCFYNPQTDLLAVEGCYWAAPYGVIVVDFRRPMIAAEPGQWTDVYEIHREAYPDLSEISFEKWDGRTLVCKASFADEKAGPVWISTDFGSPE